MEKEGNASAETEDLIEGLEERVKRTAINMLKQKLDDSLIKSVTGFSQDALDKLKNKM